MVCSDVKSDCVQDRDQVGLIRDKHRFGGHLILKATLLQTLTKIKEELESGVQLLLNKPGAVLIWNSKKWSTIDVQVEGLHKFYSLGPGFCPDLYLLPNKQQTDLLAVLDHTKEQGKSRIFRSVPSQDCKL